MKSTYNAIMPTKSISTMLLFRFFLRLAASFISLYLLASTTSLTLFGVTFYLVPIMLDVDVTQGRRQGADRGLAPMVPKFTLEI